MLRFAGAIGRVGIGKVWDKERGGLIRAPRHLTLWGESRVKGATRAFTKPLALDAREGYLRQSGGYPSPSNVVSVDEVEGVVFCQQENR